MNLFVETEDKGMPSTGYPNGLGMPPVASEPDAASIESYFQEHQIEDFLVEMLMDMGKKAPKNPWEFMQEYIGKHKGEFPDSPSAMKRQSREVAAMQRLSVQMHSETPAVQSFVKEFALKELLEVCEEEEDEDKPIECVPKVEFGRARSVPFARQKTADKLFASKPNSELELERLLSWEFNPNLELEDEELMSSAFAVFELWGLMSAFSLEADKMKNFILTVQENYNKKCHYHNFTHAYAVCSVTGNLIFYSFPSFLGKLEKLAVLVAALTHDVGHEALNNDYYVKAQHELAIRYNDQAVLENMHASLCAEIMRMEGNNFHSALSHEDQLTLRRIAITTVLATDMKVHFELTTRLQDLYGDGETAVNHEDKTNRELIQKVLIHAADISNPVLALESYKKWTYRCVLEFHEQAEREKKEGLPWAPFMEPHPDNALELAKLQIGFCSFVVKPFWSAVHKLAPKSLEPRIEQLTSNLTYWQNQKSELEEAAEKDAEKT